MRGVGRHRWAEEAGDDFNPVTDLVFTLFAVSILLLAVVGSDGAVRQEALAARLAERERAIETLREDLSNAAAGGGTAEAAIAALRRELDARDAEIERLGAEAALAAAAEARDAGPDADADAASERDALRRSVAALEGDLRDARQEAATLRAGAARRLELGTVRPGASGSFLASAGLDEGIAEEILLILGGNVERIDLAGANRIALEVDVAPAIGTGGQDAADAEYETSLAVARALMGRMRQTPVPVSCVLALPFGKSRASTLVAIGGAVQGGRLDDVEALGRDGPDLPASRAALAAAAAADNRITVVAEEVPTAPCESGRLADGIRAWVEAGP